MFHKSGGLDSAELVAGRLKNSRSDRKRMALDVHARILAHFSSPDTDPNELEYVVRNHIDETLPKLFGTSN